MALRDQITEAVAFLREAGPAPCPETAVVLGSGLGDLGDELDDPTPVETADIPHWPASTAPGHRGRIVFGKTRNVPIVAVQGRVHVYEGYSIQKVVFPIRVLGEMGIKNLILTNASGGINPAFVPGDLMLITDHINFMFTNPLIGPHDSSFGLRFPDMSRPYDSDFIAAAENAGRNLNISLKKGVLVAVSGPSYETAAEIRMLASLGADAVCMSTVPETIAAVQMGLRILGIACIANRATGFADGRLNHKEVEETTRRTSRRLIPLVQEIIVRITGQG